MKDSLSLIRLALIDQLRRQSVHTAVRIACGFLLWIAWHRVSRDAPPALSIASAAAVLLVLGGVLVWLRIPLWVNDE